MDSLFEEVDQYEKNIEDRKDCYFVTMLAMDDDLHWYKETVPIINPVTGRQDGYKEEYDFESLRELSEKQFIDYQYDSLVEIFPRASNVFKRSLFLNSDFIEGL